MIILISDPQQERANAQSPHFTSVVRILRILVIFIPLVLLLVIHKPALYCMVLYLYRNVNSPDTDKSIVYYPQVPTPFQNDIVVEEYPLCRTASQTEIITEIIQRETSIHLNILATPVRHYVVDLQTIRNY
jgi:hypothetical protein